ncbi:unnamed protein product [Caenorhabditis angaria]|uniref:Uncharacterized protein n=1 Tax=Caenorhabditis angaria TaxID=860376 RepID=A0A9P1IAG2_9PELO|nr:unnamed protein product [Caenorhabditis angaria]
MLKEFVTFVAIICGLVLCANQNPNPNPTCQAAPASTDLKYLRTTRLVIFVVGPGKDDAKREKIRYVMKQISCSVPDSMATKFLGMLYNVAPSTGTRVTYMQLSDLHTSFVADFGASEIPSCETYKSVLKFLSSKTDSYSGFTDVDLIVQRAPELTGCDLYAEFKAAKLPAEVKMFEVSFDEQPKSPVNMKYDLSAININADKDPVLKNATDTFVNSIKSSRYPSGSAETTTKPVETGGYSESVFYGFVAGAGIGGFLLGVGLLVAICLIKNRKKDGKGGKKEDKKAKKKDKKDKKGKKADKKGTSSGSGTSTGADVTVSDVHDIPAPTYKV